MMPSTSKIVASASSTTSAASSITFTNLATNAFVAVPKAQELPSATPGAIPASVSARPAHAMASSAGAPRLASGGAIVATRPPAPLSTRADAEGVAVRVGDALGVTVALGLGDALGDALGLGL